MTLRGAVLVLLTLARAGECGEPLFDPATLMRLVLVPADAAVGSVIYRVRASDPDFDYPLQFELIGQMGRLDIAIESLPCTRYNSVCQANVILLRRLEPGRYVDFRVSVRNSRGRSARIACSITGTNATTPRDTIFPHQPGIILVPEDAKRGSDLEIVIARKNPMSSKPLELELWGSPLFAIRQRRVSTENTEGTIFLLGPLDFETQSMYHLTLYAVDPFVEIGKDTRNIAGLEVVVVVQDVQDMPPVFTHAPPITHLPKQLVPGDIVVRVRAEDGDKGAPRQIRYGLVSEGNPFTPFFNINETTGEVWAERSLQEMAAISHAGAPVLLTVVAEEVRVSRAEPEAMSSTVQLALLLPERDNTPPYFDNAFYITYLDENSPQGTALVFNDPYIAQVSDNDAGKNGVFSLSLVGNNGTFEISPTVAERHAPFIVRVRDNVMLDYEARKSVVFQIVAQELGPSTNLSATANVTVYLNDVNDNSPVFLEQSYEVELAENVTAGARVAQVASEDVDTGIFGKVQYTAIIGYLNTSLNLDPMTGIITVATSNHGFDREAMPDLHFLVEARDNDGVGLRETVPLIIKLLDVNDNQPQFEKSLYEFVLSPSMSNFTSSALIKAIDKDAEPPNNVVRYEIIQGNTEAKFTVNEETGELYLLEPIKRYTQDIKRHKRQFESEPESEVYVLIARAYDLGVPRLFSTTIVKVYPPESKTKTMSFIVPGLNPDRRKLEEILSTLSGGKVTILEVRPYKGNEVGLPDVSSVSSQEKSVVVATVRQTGNSAINIAKLQEQLSKNQTIISTSVDNSQSSPGSTDTNSSGIYKAENRLLFWLLILLAIIIAIVLLALICCCICEGCPLYMPPRKRVIRVNSTEDDVHLVVRDKSNGGENKSTQHIQNKSMQATEWRRREAWSAEEADLRTKPTQWKFNRRNHRSKEPSKPASTPGDLRQEFIIPAAAKNQYEGRRSMRLRDGPNIIYTKEMQLQEAFANKHREYIEDLENGYDRIATLHYQRRDHDNDSIRRHEMERGSEVYIRSEVDKQEFDKIHATSSLGRDQYFIKEGNTEILRLVTRGNEEERYVNLPPPQRPVTLIPHTQYVVVDSGKDLLMQRFIREQGEEAKYMRDKMGHADLDMHVSNDKEQAKSQSQIGSEGNVYLNTQNVHDTSHLEVPGVVPLNSEHLQNRSNVNQDSLESSLRKQNQLLHQILLERERVIHNDTASQFEIKLETQSLPGHSVMATQTDCHMSTQTEPHLLKPTRRKARSDNDSYSEDEAQVVQPYEARQIAWVKRKKPKKKIKYKDPRKSMRMYEIKRKIRTPILEENELSPSFEGETRIKVSKTNEREEHVKNYGESTKSIVKTSKNETISSMEIKISDPETHSGLKREVLMEISDSLDEQCESSSNVKAKRCKLRRQTSLAENYEEETEEYNRTESNKNETSPNIIQNSTWSASDDSRNLVFSRQGSSTEAKELAHESATLQQSPIVEEITKEKSESSSSTDSKDSHSVVQNSAVRTSDSDVPKTVELIKTVQKSVPRYMQWYSKKSATVSKQPVEKVIPSKPKRISKLKEKNTLETEKAAHYGKIAPKEVQDEVKKNTKLKENNFKIHPRLLKEEKVKPVPEVTLPDVHPLLQHSEHRYEHQYENQNPLCYIQPTHMPQYLGMYPNNPILTQRQSIGQQPIYVNQDLLSQNTDNKISEGALTHSISISTNYEEEKPTDVHISKINIGSSGTLDLSSKSNKVEDNDSGIAMSSIVQQTGNIKRLPITEKKSIFTIAYDDVHTKQLRPDSSSTSY